MFDPSTPCVEAPRFDVKMERDPSSAPGGVGTLPATAVLAGPSRPPRGRSHHAQRRATTIPRLHLFCTVALLLSCCCSLGVTAATPVLPSALPNPLDSLPDDVRLTLDELAKTGTILIDQSPPPPMGLHWELEIEETIREGLLRRQNGGTVDQSNSTNPSSASAKASSTAPPSSSTSSPSSSSNVASSSAAASTASGTSPNSSPLPSPFDSSLGANFTQPSCPDFITSFLSNASFKACLPFSLLLESSVSFFQAEKSLVRITQTLDYTCGANVTSCTDLMYTLASNLTSSANCGNDYARENPTVLQAYTGLIAYKSVYQASCLKNPKTSAYCFADAVTNSSSPEDSYIYYLALNGTLPGGSQPTCNTCLQNTMAVFAAAAANRSQPVASTYISAAQIINVNCGPGFVNSSIPAPLSSAAPAVLGPGMNSFMGTWVLITILLAWFL